MPWPQSRGSLANRLHCKETDPKSTIAEVAGHLSPPCRTITDKINNVVALLLDQCNCGTPSEIKAAFQELQAALNQLTAVTAIIATLPQ
jgi:hypothetical protein